MSKHIEVDKLPMDTLEIAEARLLLTYAQYHKFVGQKYVSHPTAMQFARSLSKEKAWDIVLQAPDSSFDGEH
jgi:hypothetical protein